VAVEVCARPITRALDETVVERLGPSPEAVHAKLALRDDVVVNQDAPLGQLLRDGLDVAHLMAVEELADFVVHGHLPSKRERLVAQAPEVDDVRRLAGSRPAEPGAAHGGGMRPSSNC